MELNYHIPDKECHKEIGVDHKLYGLHSLRSGGATSAVSYNPSLSERVLKLHGWWKSDTAKDMYILEDVAKRLQETSQLGLYINIYLVRFSLFVL